MNKRYIVRDELDIEDPIILDSKEYVAALEEALLKTGRRIMEIREDQLDLYTEEVIQIHG